MSTIFLLTPTLTLGPSRDAQRFFAACKEQLATYVPVSEINNAAVLRAARPGNCDAVVVFNRGDGQYDPLVLGFLTDSLRDKAVVVSVAINPDSRCPPPPFQKEQSFDVTEHLRRRSLTSGQL